MPRREIVLRKPERTDRITVVFGGRRVEEPVALKDGSFGTDIYEYNGERDEDGRLIAAFVGYTEIMPPKPPQILGYGDDVRLPMMDEYGYSVVLEAAQRRKEWAAMGKPRPDAAL